MSLDVVPPPEDVLPVPGAVPAPDVAPEPLGVTEEPLLMPEGVPDVVPVPVADAPGVVPVVLAPCPVDPVLPVNVCASAMPVQSAIVIAPKNCFIAYLRK